MKQLLTIFLTALGFTTVLIAIAQAGTGTVVAVRKTALGNVLVDARGRTLYLFEKDRNGVSACNAACVKFWPALTSQGAPRAGTGVQQSLLRLGRPHNGVRQVIYAGHPLYTFAGDTRAGQTTGEGLNKFGAEWYALTAGGAKAEQSPSTSTSTSGGY